MMMVRSFDIESRIYGGVYMLWWACVLDPLGKTEISDDDDRI